MINRKVFFDSVRYSIFDGSLNQRQVEGMDALLDAWDDAGATDLRWLASIMGNVRIEVGANMYPVREGFATNDADAIAHVTKLYNAGKVKKNYALPDERGLSPYGRGQIQVTHWSNIKWASSVTGVDCYADPDRLLEPKISAICAVRGCIDGAFRRGKKCSVYFTDTNSDWAGARDMVNGDARTRGAQLEQFSVLFFTALERAAVAEVDHPKPPKGDEFMNFILAKVLSGLVRHVATAIGAVLVSKGILDEGTVTELVAGITMFLVGLVDSASQKISDGKR